MILQLGKDEVAKQRSAYGADSSEHRGEGAHGLVSSNALEESIGLRFGIRLEHLAVPAIAESAGEGVGRLLHVCAVFIGAGLGLQEGRAVWVAEVLVVIVS